MDDKVTGVEYDLLVFKEFIDSGRELSIANHYWHDPYKLWFGKDKDGYYRREWTSLESNVVQVDENTFCSQNDIKIRLASFDELKASAIRGMPCPHHPDSDRLNFIVNAILDSDGQWEAE